MNQNKIKLAVVDDDESFAPAIERRFRSRDLKSSIYSSAEAFLASTMLPPPDCLVLDIQLGGMSGWIYSGGLHELGARAPIIFVTAHDSPAVRQEAEQAGCSAYFLKPVPTKLLIEAITQAVNPNRSQVGEPLTQFTQAAGPGLRTQRHHRRPDDEQQMN